MLGDSLWGFVSEKLVNIVLLIKVDVKWCEVFSKWFWLVGMVKDKMCVLFDVDELIVMLDNGLGSKDQVLQLIGVKYMSDDRNNNVVNVDDQVL